MTSPQQIQAWVAQGESETQEFKLSTGQRTDAARSLCAFLNHRGGRVLFGVDPRGHIVGQDTNDKTLADIAYELRQIDPPTLPDIERIALPSGREILAVTVERGPRRPYSFRDEAYRRVGTTNHQLSRHEYGQILLEQLHSTVRWESEPATGWTIADLDTTEIVRTLEEAIRRGRADDPGTRDPNDILRGLGLIKDGQILRAAIVLFAMPERLLPDFPQCLLRIARFRGADKTEFLDNRQFHGNAFDLLRRADRFLRDHLPVAGRIVPNLFERIDDPLYPPLALREAVANALCHRDYAIGGGSIGLAIYDDRLEITSSGALHFGLTVDDLYRPHESLLWNPLIAGVFYRRGIIEAWGRGTLKMTELTEQAGLPRPEFQETAGALLVRFRPNRYLPPKRIGHNLTEQQQAILQLLASSGELALREIHHALRLGTLRSVREDLAFLKRLGVLDTSGYARGARWRLTDQQGTPASVNSGQ
jgi:ATP-dependent DNA helicase RecG